VQANPGGLCPVPRLSWQGHTPRGLDLYHQAEHGLAESEHVYLLGNDLPRRFADCTGRFTLAEVGFGAGLNFLASVRLWRQRAPTSASLRYIAFEPMPLAGSQLAYALAPFAELAAFTERLLAIYPPLLVNSFTLRFAEDIELELHFFPLQESARPFVADAWFYDAFAPARDPAAWNARAMQTVASTSRPGTSIATFSVAAAARKGLEVQGFAVRRAEGYGEKRHMLRGKFQGKERVAGAGAMESGMRIAIIGGGLAGCALAASLAELMKLTDADGGPTASITLFERRAALAERASRHRHAVLFAKVPWLADWRQRWLWRCWCESYSYFTLFPDLFTRLPKILLPGGKRGANWLAGWRRTWSARAHGDWLAFDTPSGGLCLPRAGLLDMQRLAKMLAAGAAERGVAIRTGAWVRNIALGLVEFRQDGSHRRESFTHLAFCANGGVASLLALEGLHCYKGQVNRLEVSGPLRQIYGSGAGYIAPAGEGMAECGGEFLKDFANLRARAGQGEGIRRALAADFGAPDEQFGGRARQTGAWADLRSTGRDHLPLVGLLRNGLYLNCGYGGKGSLAITPTSRMLAAAMQGDAGSFPEELRPTRF